LFSFVFLKSALIVLSKAKNKKKNVQIKGDWYYE